MASRKLSLINQDHAPVQMSLLALPGTSVRGLEESFFPKIVHDAAGFKEVLRRSEKLGLLGVDYEFKSYDRPTIMGIAVRDLACGVPFDRTLHRYIADAARSGIKLVAHSAYSADRPVFDCAEGFESPLEWWIDSLLTHWFENSHLTKTPGKDESDDSGALGLCDLWTATSLVTSVPNWKEHRGSACHGPCPKCLRGSTRVYLEDGTPERINKLVKDQYAGRVQCVDAAGNIQLRRVTNWVKSDRGDRKFMQVGYQHAGSNRKGAVVTEDHQFLTRRGYIEAQALVETDEICTGLPGLSSRQEEILCGVLLGDSSCSEEGIRLIHGVAQEEYLDLKIGVFANLGTLTKVHNPEVLRSGKSKVGASCSVRLPKLPATKKAAWQYVNNWRDYLSANFSTKSLAIWYMDDGCLHSGAAEITVSSRTDDDCLFLLNLIQEKTGLVGAFKKSSVVPARCNHNKRILRFSQAETIKLVRLISCMVPPSLQYKLSAVADAPMYDAASYAPDFETDWQRVKFYEVSPSFDDATVYCIEVEEFHNFVTSGGVVKNCDVLAYCAADSWGGLEVHIENKRRLLQRGFSWRTFENRSELAAALHKMEVRGVKIDRRFVANFSENLETLREGLFPAGDDGEPIPFNPRSSQQVEAWFKQRKIALKSNQKNDIRKALEVTAARFGFDSIEALEQAEDVPEALSVLHKLDQYKGSGKGGDAWFADKYFDKEGLVHPRFIYVGTSTGRLSSSKPNFQNVPSRGWGALIKAAIIPHDPDFDIIDADLGQLELRDVLYQAGFDIRSIKGDALQFIVEQGGDRFDRAAQIAGGEARDIVKTVVYGGQYGEGLQIYTGADLLRPTTQREIAAGAIRLYTPQYVPWLTKAWEYGGGIVGFTGANLAERLFGDKSWESRKKALEIQDDLIFGGDLRIIREWQIKTLDEIESKGYVDLPNTQFLRLNGSPRDNAKVGLAFKGQGLGAVHAQATMLACIRENKTLPLLQVHDSLVYAVNRSWSDKRVREFIEPMFGETSVLPGFKAPGKVKRGRNYGGFDEKLNPGGLKLIWNSAKENVDGSKV